MGMSTGGGSDGAKPTINVTPLIDVLLVLLIFFMCITSAEVLKVDKEIKLPVSPNAKKRDPEMAKHEIAINVRWNDATKKSLLIVDDKQYPTISELVPYLKERRAKDDKVRAVVRGDSLLPAIEVQRVMNLVGEGGIADISFSASNK